MKHCHYSDVPQAAVEIEGAEGVGIRRLIDAKTGAPNFAMRHFEVAPGGCTPRHTHAWEHEVFILSGEGVARGNGQDNAVRPGDVLFVPGGDEHQFRNTGAQPLTFLCLIPITG